MILLLVAACATNARSRYVQYRETQHAIQEQTTTLLKADAIKIEDAELILAIMKQVDTRLDEFAQGLASGKPKAMLNAILDTVRSLLSDAAVAQRLFKKGV